MFISLLGHSTPFLIMPINPQGMAGFTLRSSRLTLYDHRIRPFGWTEALTKLMECQGPIPIIYGRALPLGLIIVSLASIFVYFLFFSWHRQEMLSSLLIKTLQSSKDAGSVASRRGVALAPWPTFAFGQHLPLLGCLGVSFLHCSVRPLV